MLAHAHNLQSTVHTGVLPRGMCPDVVRVFEFLKNHQLWFFKTFWKLGRLLVLVLWGKFFKSKNQNQRTIDSGYFKTLKRPMVFVKELRNNWWFYYGQLFGLFERIKDRGLYQIQLFELFWNPWLWCSQKGIIYEF
jgi:hypothetical protein